MSVQSEEKIREPTNEAVPVKEANCLPGQMIISNASTLWKPRLTTLYFPADGAALISSRLQWYTQLITRQAFFISLLVLSPPTGDLFLVSC